jgi:hypothetical protein
MCALRFYAKRIMLSNLADDSGPQDRAELSGTARALSLRKRTIFRHSNAGFAGTFPRFTVIFSLWNFGFAWSAKNGTVTLDPARVGRDAGKILRLGV